MICPSLEFKFYKFNIDIFFRGGIDEVFNHILRVVIDFLVDAAVDNHPAACLNVLEKADEVAFIEKGDMLGQLDQVV
jgi:hypothetical protein